MPKTRVDPKFTVTPPPAPPKPTVPNGVSGAATRMSDWVAADQAFKESQPQIVSDGGKGVSN